MRTTPLARVKSTPNPVWWASGPRLKRCCPSACSAEGNPSYTEKRVGLLLVLGVISSESSNDIGNDIGNDSGNESCGSGPRHAGQPRARGDLHWGGARLTTGHQLTKHLTRARRVELDRPSTTARPRSPATMARNSPSGTKYMQSAASPGFTTVAPGSQVRVSPSRANSARMSLEVSGLAPSNVHAPGLPQMPQLWRCGAPVTIERRCTQQAPGREHPCIGQHCAPFKENTP